jgi:hypothetical protein
MTPTRYTLNGQQLEAAFVALRKASEAFRLSPLEHRLYRALGLCATVAIAAAVLIEGLVVTIAVRGKSEPLLLLLGISAVLFALSGSAATLLLLLNLGVVRNTLRQRRLLRWIGLEDVARWVWKRQERTLTPSSIGRALLTAVAVLFTLLVLLWALRVKRPQATEILVAVSFFFGGVTFLVWQYVQQSRERLTLVADANRLREALSSIRRDSNDRVEVQAIVLEEVAGLEQAQIARARAQAVVAGVQATDRAYGVQVTREVLEKKAGLPPDQRLEAEELIDQVVEHAQAPAAGDPSPDSSFRFRSATGSLEVGYQIDRDRRCVQIVSLHAPGAVASKLPRTRNGC